MDSDEELREENTLPNSKIGGLILKLNKMLKKPAINFDLDQTLDSFMVHLNETQQYLSNGIFNVKFAEAGLFLQSSVALYGKKVDLLWDDALDYQMQLCSYNKSEDNAEEKNKIVQRMSRKKRRKTILETKGKHLTRDLAGALERSSKLMDIIESNNHADEIEGRWKKVWHGTRFRNLSFARVPKDRGDDSQTQIIPNSYEEQQKKCINISCDIYFPIKTVSNTTEKEGRGKENTEKEEEHSFNNLFINTVVPRLLTTDYKVYNSSGNNKSANIISRFSVDWILQIYMKKTHLTYNKLWTDGLADNFEAFKEKYVEEQQKKAHSALRRDVRNSFVNLNKLPDELMAEFEKDNDDRVRLLIRDLLLKDEQTEAARLRAIKSGSERISNADSLFLEQSDVPCTSQQSMSDSGFFSIASGLNDSDVFSGDDQRSTRKDSGFFSDENGGAFDDCACDEHDNVDNDNSEIHPETTEPTDTEQGNSANSEHAVIPDVLTEESSIGRDLESTDKNETVNTSTVLEHEIVNTGTEHETTAEEDSSMGPDLDLIGRNECVEMQGNSVSSPELPPFLPCHTRSIIQPAREREKNLKRKLSKTQSSEEKSEKHPRQKRFKWLKTTTTLGTKFEKFYLRNYEPEFGEADHNMPSEWNDTDTESVLSDRVMPEDFDEVNEHEADVCSNVVEAVNEINNATANTVDETTENITDTTPNLADATKEPSAADATAEISTTRLEESSISAEEPISVSNNQQAEDPDDVDNGSFLPDSSRISTYESETLERMRAKDWEKFIEPKLKDAERSSKFDIHEYGTRVMDAIPQDQNLPFKELAQGKDAFEVSRLFLASLQLANTYNVEIVAPQQGEVANDTFELKLLTRERYHEHLNEYEAPSENTFRERLARVQIQRPSVPLHSTPIAAPIPHKRQTSKRRRL